jgi:glyoxylase I family protein
MNHESNPPSAVTAGPMTGLSHVQLRVSNVGDSAAWYAAALGLQPFRADPTIGFVALRHLISGVVIVLTEETSRSWDADSGALDHLAFAVPDGSTLDTWAEHLTSVGIDHAGVVLENGNPSLQLLDPDGTAIELVAPRQPHA